jgi:hypothetical protein
VWEGDPDKTKKHLISPFVPSLYDNPSDHPAYQRTYDYGRDIDCGHRFLISRTKIQMNQRPPVTKTIAQSRTKFQNPYFLRDDTYTFIFTP